MVDSKSYQELKRRILALRPQMIGLSSACHWLRIHRDLRKVLDVAFFKMSAKDVAQIIGFPVEAIERWAKERDAVADLKQRMSTAKPMGRQKLSHTILLRPEIVALARLASLQAVSDVLGISKTTLWRWCEQDWDKIPVAETDANKESSLADAPVLNPITLIQNLAETAEARELSALLTRHEGKTKRKYSLSERKLFLELVERFGSKLVHEHFKISYDTIARLLRKKTAEIERVTRVPIRYAPVLDLMKQHPGMGPMQVRDYMRRHFGLSMGVNSIRKVMEEQGWVPPFVRIPRLKEGAILYEAVRRNYLWHMDFKHQYINKCKVFVLIIQDDYSRFIVNHAIAEGETIETVVTALDDAIRLHGKPEVVMSDGGSAFYAWRGVGQLTRYLEDCGVDQIIAKTPNVNGKLENLNQQLEKEVLLVHDFASLQHFQKELAGWVAFYNFRRPHQGLADRQVPADRFFPGAMHWFGETTDITKQQSLIAETMATLLSELKKPR